MAVANNVDKVIYTGDDVSDSFTFSFGVYAATDLIVYKQVISSGVITTLSLNTDYTVTLTPLSGTSGAYTGTATLVAGALASTYKLIILRSIPFTQLINISDYAATPAATWQQGLDRATILSIQLLEMVNRALLLPVSQTTQISVPSPSSGYVLGWDALGNLVNVATPTAVIPVPLADSYLQTITTAGKVNMSALIGLLAAAGTISGAALTSLANIPSGAGVIPTANLPSLYTLKVKIGQFSRDVSAADGNVSYTGVGFTPKLLIFFGALPPNATMFWSAATATAKQALTQYASGIASELFTTAIAITISAGNSDVALLASLDSDGWKLTWSKTGSPTGTAVINYIAIG